VAAEPVPEFHLAVAVDRLLELKPADEGVPDALAGRGETAPRDAPLPFVRPPLSSLDRDDDPQRVDHPAHLRIAVELDEVVEVRLRERPQTQPLRLERPFHQRKATTRSRVTYARSPRNRGGEGRVGA